MRRGIFLFSILFSANIFADVDDFDKFSAIKNPKKLESCKANWYDSCQDEVLKYFYGNKWREFKNTILQYKKSIRSRDIDKISKLVTFPNVVTTIGSDDYKYHIRYIKPCSPQENNEIKIHKFYELARLHKIGKEQNKISPAPFEYKDIRFSNMQYLLDQNFENPFIFPFKDNSYAIQFSYMSCNESPKISIFIPKIFRHSILEDTDEKKINFINKTDFIDDQQAREECSRNWNDSCQDKVLKHFYGESWQSFKEVILEYQKVFPFKTRAEFDKFFSLFNLPSKTAYLYPLNNDADFHPAEHIHYNYDEFKSIYYSDSEANLIEAANAKYSEMIFHVFKKENPKLHHMIKFTDNFAISFNVIDYENSKFEPKIYAIFYNFYEMPRNVNKLSLINDGDLKSRCKTNWDDSCQDEVMLQLFGKNWQEFKDAIISWQKAIIDKDIKASYGLINLPFTYEYAKGKVNNKYIFGGYKRYFSFSDFSQDFYDISFDHYEKLINPSDKINILDYKDFEFYFTGTDSNQFVVKIMPYYGVGFYYEVYASQKDIPLPKIDLVLIF